MAEFYQPTCGAVIQKNDEAEYLCAELATALVNIANPDDHSQIQAVVLVCERHEKMLDDGRQLIFLHENKVDHIYVQLGENLQEENVSNDAKPRYDEGRSDDGTRTPGSPDEARGGDDGRGE